MSTADAQKSEVHDTTADSTSSPSAQSDARTTSARGQSASGPKVPIQPIDPHTKIVKDETDAGGPLVIESDDPKLQSPGVTPDVTTEGTPGLGPPTKSEDKT